MSTNEEPKFEIREATATDLVPLVSFFGESATGKTLSALLYARGIVGPKGKIGGVDTENKRMSIFADRVPGGFVVIDLPEPFSPMRYQAAIGQLEEVVDIIVVDSMSHEWEGPGGILEWQEEELHKLSGGDYAKAEKMKLLSWQKPKRAHKALLQWMLRSTKPVILCFRAEKKTHFATEEEQQQGQQRKKASVITDQFTTPIGAKNFVWECLVTYEMVQREVDGRNEGGFSIARKWTHPDVRGLLPRPEEQIGIKHGEALAAWCRRASRKTPAALVPASGPVTQSAGDVRGNLLLVLRNSTRTQSGWDGKAGTWALAKQRLQQWLIDEAIISDTQAIDTLTDGELEAVVNKIKARQQTNP
jgi:hypothetical protein